MCIRDRYRLFSYVPLAPVGPCSSPLWTGTREGGVGLDAVLLKAKNVIEAQRPAVPEVDVPAKDRKAGVVGRGTHPTCCQQHLGWDADGLPQVGVHALPETGVPRYRCEVDLVRAGH